MPPNVTVRTERTGHVDLVAAATYDPESAAVPAARRFIRETLRSWQVLGCDDLLADAELLTSELVTNAVLHAQTPVHLTCRADGCEVEVSVLDRQPGRTIPGGPGRIADAHRAAGRGLVLLAALSSSWGVTYAPAAKAVWFRLRPDGAGPADPDVYVAAAMGRGDGFGQAGPRSFAATARSDADLLRLGSQELLDHTAGLARDTVHADAAYVLIADEDGVLRIRAAAGLSAPYARERPAGQATRSTPGDHPGMGIFRTVYHHLAENGAGGRQIAAGTPQSFLTVPVLADGRVAGVIAVIAAEPGRFTGEDSARLRHIASQVALPLERARLNEQDRAHRRRISFLAEASDLLAGTLDQEQAIALAAQLVVPRLAAWCAVLLTDENGACRPARVWHADEARNDALSYLLSRVPPPQASSLGAGLQWPPAVPQGEQLTPEAAELAADPAWSFPLLARGRSLGVLVMGRPGGGALGSQPLAVAEDLTRRVALAMDNARLYTEQLQASHALQRTLLPPQLPEVPGLDVAAGYQAAGEGDEVGGDFYDAFKVAPGRWRFAIGDVCGKGLEAAAVTGLTRHALRILARDGHDIPAVLERLNSLILEEGSAVPFVTLIHGEIDISPGRASVSMVCAGHPPPLLLRSQGGTKIAAGSQPLLGVMEDVTFRCDTCHIRQGDVLLCVTDGVTERRSGDRLLDDDNGLSRLLSDCSGLNAGAIVARLQREVREFGFGPPTDDTALIAFRGQ
jgi:serine phosphatase RsbU (regulator of sigma subunit)/anti-sigma regulatory factor (Ser/Thr protein kinase)